MQTREVFVPPPPKQLFRLLGTPVQADASAPLNLAGTYAVCWMLVEARYPEHGPGLRAVLALIWAGLLMAVFGLHSLGHMVSARAVGAPMDVLLVNAVHWVTLYLNDNVPPRMHMGRAVGGPLANVAALLVARVARPLLPPGPLGRDLADVFSAFNAALCAAALLPTPSFDGGVLLKWSAYNRTGSLTQAAGLVRRAGVGAALGLAGLASAALLGRRRGAGMILAAFSLVTALESIRRDG